MTFFTATIKDWKCLLLGQEMKFIVINSLAWLSEHRKANIHAFVIMPNHIHLLWSKVNCDERYLLEQNFLSHTAHAFKRSLAKSNKAYLAEFKVLQIDREYNFWQQKSKSIELMSRKIAEQKLDYIHFNPVSKGWNLADTYVDYTYSSAAFYELDDGKYEFLKHYADYI